MYSGIYSHYGSRDKKNNVFSVNCWLLSGTNIQWRVELLKYEIHYNPQPLDREKNLGLLCSLQIGSKLRYLHNELSNHRVTQEDCCDNRYNQLFQNVYFCNRFILQNNSLFKGLDNSMPDYMLQLAGVLHHQNFPHRQKSLAFCWTGVKLGHQPVSCHIVKHTQQDWYHNHLNVISSSKKLVQGSRLSFQLASPVASDRFYSLAKTNCSLARYSNMHKCQPVQLHAVCFEWKTGKSKVSVPLILTELPSKLLNWHAEKHSFLLKYRFTIFTKTIICST